MVSGHFEGLRYRLGSLRFEDSLKAAAIWKNALTRAVNAFPKTALFFRVKISVVVSCLRSFCLSLT